MQFLLFLEKKNLNKNLKLLNLETFKKGLMVAKYSISHEIDRQNKYGYTITEDDFPEILDKKSIAFLLNVNIIKFNFNLKLHIKKSV